MTPLLFNNSLFACHKNKKMAFLLQSSIRTQPPNGLRNLPGDDDPKRRQQGIFGAPSRRLERSGSRVWLTRGWAAFHSILTPVVHIGKGSSSKLCFRNFFKTLVNKAAPKFIAERNTASM